MPDRMPGQSPWKLLVCELNSFIGLITTGFKGKKGPSIIQLIYEKLKDKKKC